LGRSRVNLTRFHGVFAPNSGYRARVTPAKRGTPPSSEDSDTQTPAERRASMSWAQRLKRAFGIDIQTCPACGGVLRIIACIEDPSVIERILTHLAQKDASAPTSRLPPSRAPPQGGRLH
jgi:hypothetical protein